MAVRSMQARLQGRCLSRGDVEVADTSAKVSDLGGNLCILQVAVKPACVRAFKWMTDIVIVWCVVNAASAGTDCPGCHDARR